MSANFFVSRLRRLLVSASFLLALTALVPQFASAQGFLIEPINPRPLPRWIVRPVPMPTPAPEPIPYKIESLDVDATINNSVAKVDVSQTFKNEGSSTIETSFVFPLPYDGAIDSMTLLVNGKEYPAKLLGAKEARETYEAIVRKNKDPALLEWIGTGMFQTSVFPIPAGESRTVSISYSQILRTSSGLTDFLFPLSCAKYTSKPVEKTTFSVTIVGDSEIKNVYSPTYDLKIERNGANVVKATYSLENKVPVNDFRIFFDQSADDLAAKVQSYRPNDSEDGYFLLLAAPKIANEESQPLPKTIVFALDVSGSMSGEKINQARDSLKFVLERLRDGDKFAIVLFSNEATSYKPELQVCSAETRADALAFVSSVRARGGTNIEDALKVATAMFDKDDGSNPKYLLMLSDGEPTVNECNEMKLAQIARDSNKAKARVCTFGVGYDVNSRLLDRFVRDGRGQGEYVKPDEKIEDAVSKLYGHIEDPIFSEVSFEFAMKNEPDKKYFTNLVYPSEPTDVFAGEQIVLVGRYSASGDITISAKGKIGDKDVQFDFDGSLIEKSSDSSYAYVERLWAARRVGEIIDQLDLNGMNQELMDELLKLAKEHGILTPYTSFLADDSVALNDASNNRLAASNFDAMASQTSNSSGFAQRSFKQFSRNQMNVADSADYAAEEAVAMSAPPVGGMGGGMGGGVGMAASGSRSLAQKAAAPRLSFSNSGIRHASSDSGAARSPRETMRNIAGKTFYLKDGRWVDASIDEKMEQSQKPIVLSQFSDEYFKAVAENGQNFSQYLVFTEPVTLNYNGQIYNIDPEK